MRSIIDEIAHAELEAEAIRQNAITEARERVQKARAAAEDDVARFTEREREATRLALEKSETDGKRLAEGIHAELLSDAEIQCAKAEKRMDDVISYLMRKVQENA